MIDTNTTVRNVSRSGSPVPPARLAELLAPASLATLLEHLESRSILHLPAPQRDRFDGLFSWTHLEEIVACGFAETDRIFLFAGGRQLDATRLGVIAGPGRFDPAGVRSLFKQGATFSLPNIQAHFEETRRLVSDIEWCLGERVELRVVASPSSGIPIPLHFDVPDLLVLQIAGDKQWRFFGEPAPDSCRYRTLDEPPSNVTAQIHLQRGDVLFIPSGLHHQCQPEGDSLHLAISIYRRTSMDFFDHLRRLAGEEPGFFDGLPNRGSADALDRRQAWLKERLASLIETTDLRAFLDEDDRRRARPRHVALTNPDPLDRNVEMLLESGWTRRVALPKRGPVSVGTQSFDLDPAALFAFDRLQAEGQTTSRGLMDDVDRVFGAGEGANTIRALVDAGLIRAFSR